MREGRQLFVRWWSRVQAPHPLGGLCSEQLSQVVPQISVARMGADIEAGAMVFLPFNSFWRAKRASFLSVGGHACRTAPAWVLVQRALEPSGAPNIRCPHGC